MFLSISGIKYIHITTSISWIFHLPQLELSAHSTTPYPQPSNVGGLFMSFQCSCCQTRARRGGNGHYCFPTDLDDGVPSIQRTVTLRGALTSWSWQPARVFPALATSCSHCWLCCPRSARTAYNASQRIARPRQDPTDPPLDCERGQFNFTFNSQLA